MKMLALLFRLGAASILEKKVMERTALYLACSNGHTNAASYLIEQGAKTNKRGPLSKSLLHAAADHGHAELLEFLLNKGLTVSAHCDDFGLTAFYCAARSGHLEAARIMLAHDAYINEADGNEWTPLHWAALQGEVETAKFLVRNGADVNAVSYFEDTPLHLAALGGHESVAQFLIRKGADRRVRNKAHQIPAECCEEYMPVLLPENELSEELSPSC